MALAGPFILKLKNCQKENKNDCPGKSHVISLNLGNKNASTFICLFQISFDSISNLTQMCFMVCPMKTTAACREGQGFAL